jgi:tRNA U38,U39,U40 pseudouridine synthase TruA
MGSSIAFQQFLNPFNWVSATIQIMACGEVYHLDLCTDPVLSPLKAGIAWHISRQLDADVLWDALALYIGRHDFHSARRPMGYSYNK